MRNGKTGNGTTFIQIEKKIRDVNWEVLQKTTDQQVKTYKFHFCTIHQKKTLLLKSNEECKMKFHFCMTNLTKFICFLR